MPNNEFAEMSKQDIMDAVEQVAYEEFIEGYHSTVEEAIAKVMESDPELYDAYRNADSRPVVTSEITKSAPEFPSQLHGGELSMKDYVYKALESRAEVMRLQPDYFGKTREEVLVELMVKDEDAAALYEIASRHPDQNRPISDIRRGLYKSADGALGDALATADRWLRP